jgi:hypothetical protein
MAIKRPTISKPGIVKPNMGKKAPVKPVVEEPKAVKEEVVEVVIEETQEEVVNEIDVPVEEEIEVPEDMIYEFNEPSLRLLRENNIKIHCVKFNIDEKEWKKRRDERLKKESADSIERKNIHEDILYFFSNEKIFNHYTDELDIEVHNVDANGNMMKVYMNFLEVIRNIIEN